MHSCTLAFLNQTAGALADGRCGPRDAALVLGHIFSIHRDLAVPTTGRNEATRIGLQLSARCSRTNSLAPLGHSCPLT